MSEEKMGLSFPKAKPFTNALDLISLILPKQIAPTVTLFFPTLIFRLFIAAGDFPTALQIRLGLSNP